jgi:hypothetical protein
MPSRPHLLTRTLALMGWLLAVAGGARAEKPLPEPGAPVRQSGRTLELDFRLPEPGTVSKVEASQGDTALKAGFSPFAGKSAYLFLIDSSDPNRKEAVAAGRAWILSLAQGADAPPEVAPAKDSPGAAKAEGEAKGTPTPTPSPGTEPPPPGKTPEGKAKADAEPAPRRERLWAVYGFDTELRTFAEFGTSPAELPEKLKGLKAEGQATELYRNVAAAAALMKPLRADRKFLVVLSDGKPEDLPTHTLDTAVAAAAEAGVTIVGLGFAEKPSEANRLTTLRDLADRTGGFFAKASEDGKRTIPAPFAGDFFALAESGGRAVVELAGAKPGKPVRIVVTAADGTAYVREAALAAAGPWYRSPWLVGSVAGVLLLAMMLFGLLRGRPAASATESGGPSDTIHGWLEVIDGDAPQRHPIRGTAVRVGRGARNDLRLTNDSVSEMHAEIIRRRDGSVTLTDLGSSNGCRLNGDIVEHSVLRGGDVLEFGDVIVRYSESLPDPANPEQA